MFDARYKEVVKSTFEEKPLRTVLMIDDEFPTYSDLLDGASNGGITFKQKDLALKLYNSFRKNEMICDIENVPDEVIRLESIRKSDLILLDFNLGPVAGSSERSISILRGLASSKHFNTVVVFTAEPNLDLVWLEVIASLGGGWTSYPGELSGVAKEHWERLADEERLPDISLGAVMEFAHGRSIDCLSEQSDRLIRAELEELGVPKSACTDIIKALINVAMASRAGKHQGDPRHYAIGGCSNETRWIQTKNTFIVVHGKSAELTDNEKDPAGILAAISRGLVAWRPNLIQIVVSEIQNILEVEALISGDELLRDPATQAALWHFVLDGMAPINPDEPTDVRAPLSALVE